jgi:hypothetical protein
MCVTMYTVRAELCQKVGVTNACNVHVMVCFPPFLCRKKPPSCRCRYQQYVRIWKRCGRVVWPGSRYLNNTISSPTLA